jgi:hypothetical protein
MAADDLGSLEPGEAGIVEVLFRLRQMKSNGPAYAELVIRLDRLSRPQDVPILLRELSAGPTEPILVTLAQQWKEDRTAQAVRAADPSPAVRRAALRAVAYGSPPTADQLRVVADRLIDDPDAAVRDEAAAAVKYHGGVVFAKLLVDRLDRVPPAQLADVVRLLAEQGNLPRNNTATPATHADSYAVTKQLERLMTHPQAAVRAAAVSQPPPSEVIWPTPVAARLAEDPDAAVRLSLARTLRNRLAGTSPAGLRLLDDADPEVRGAAFDAVLFSPIMQSTLRPENIVAKLAECVNFPDPFVRGRLKLSPFFWTSPAVAGPFGKALAGDRGPRLAALEAMANGVPASLRPAVEKLLDHPDPITRARAYAAAGNLPLNGALAVRFATAALQDNDASVRYAASESLARIPRADMAVVAPHGPDGPPSYARQTNDLNLPPDANLRAVALVEAYVDRMNADKVLDLLGSDDPRAVGAAVALLHDAYTRPWSNLKPLTASAAQRGGRAAAMVGLVVRESTRSDRANINSPPDPANLLTRALRGDAGGEGRDAALARMALRETPAAEAAAARSLIEDQVPTVRSIAVSAASATPSGTLPSMVLAALDDPDPEVASRAASAVVSILWKQQHGKPPPELPQPAADRLAAADATVRVAAVTESARAADGKAAFLQQWSTLMMTDPDPAVRAAVAAALRQVYTVASSTREQ